MGEREGIGEGKEVAGHVIGKEEGGSRGKQRLWGWRRRGRRGGGGDGRSGVRH